jgi:hypothetical protein
MTAGRISVLCELSNPKVSELLSLGQDVPIKMNTASQSLPKLDSNHICVESITFTIFSPGTSLLINISS